MTPEAAAWVNPHQRHGTRTVEGRRGLAHHGSEELALPLGPAEVALGVGVAGPDVAEGVLAVEGLAALLQVDVRLVVLDVAGHAHVDAAEAVDDAGEPAEADLDVAVDGQSGRLLERLRRAAFGPPMANAALTLLRPSPGISR